jgi:ATP-binding cassette subfamily C protein CydCD
VGVLSALVVRAVKNGMPLGRLMIALAIAAPLAGLLHWLESWLAHDMAYRLLLDMRLDMFRKLDALAPAYLSRRRTGDLVGVATRDVELIEYFFAHTITPAFVAVLVPVGVLVTLACFGWPIASRPPPLPRVGRPHPDSRPRAHRPAGLAGARGLGRSHRPRGGLRAGPGRDRGLSPGGGEGS